eukprot:scaffold59035_cov63-Phaeocystis_antarctica.AAC.6
MSGHAARESRRWGIRDMPHSHTGLLPWCCTVTCFLRLRPAPRGGGATPSRASPHLRPRGGERAASRRRPVLSAPPLPARPIHSTN